MRHSASANATIEASYSNSNSPDTHLFKWLYFFLLVAFVQHFQKIGTCLRWNIANSAIGCLYFFCLLVFPSRQRGPRCSYLISLFNGCRSICGSKRSSRLLLFCIANFGKAKRDGRSYIFFVLVCVADGTAKMHTIYDCIRADGSYFSRHEYNVVLTRVVYKGNITRFNHPVMFMLIE